MKTMSRFVALATLAATALCACGEGALDLEGGDPGTSPVEQAAGCTACKNELPGDTIGVVAQNHLAWLFNQNAPVAPSQFQFGKEHTAFVIPPPIAGDWDGDGLDSLGVYDPRQAEFQLKNANTYGAPDLVFSFGPTGSKPIAGDFDGDGDDTIGVFKNGTFRLRNSNDSGVADLTFAFGPPGKVLQPLAGDWDGDGVDTIGVFDQDGAVFHLRNSNSEGSDDLTFSFGDDQSLAFAGDFDGDGDVTIGVYHPIRQLVLLRNTNAAGPADVTVQLPDVPWLWRPVAGNWAKSPPAPVLGFEWPTGTPASQNIDGAKLALAVQQASELAPMHSLLVLRNGVLVSETYFHGGHRNLIGNVKSVSKSFLSAVTQIAIDQGKAKRTDTLDALVPDYFDANTDPEKKLITLSSMLNMRAGLQWNDQADLPDMISSVEWAKLVFDKPVVARPGQQFTYSTGLTHLTAVSMANRVGPLDAFAQQHLFGPAGIATHRWDVDPLGRFVGGCEMFFTPRDMARLGELYRRDGDLDGQQIISAAAVRRATDGPSYDSYWWFKQSGGHDVFYAAGHGGQLVFGVRSLQLVVVATSHPNVPYSDSGAQLNAIHDVFDDYIIPAVKP